MDSIGFVLVVVIVCAIIALIYHIILLYYVSEMATARGHSVFFWVSFSLLMPWLGIILLACIGETEEKRKERLFQDERYLKKLRD